MLYLKKMDENIKPVLIYLPVLHPELISDTLPKSFLDEVFFIDPGLGKTTPEYKFYTSPYLVYSPKEARACLNDLIAFQAEAEDLSTAAARQIADNFWGSLSKLESDDLKKFAEGSGKIALESSPEEKLRREIHEQAQKNLLLAWSQEENILAIEEILKQLGQSSGELAEILEDSIEGGRKTGSGHASVDGMVDLIMQESGMVPDDLKVRWSAVLTGALCLTEPETCFCASIPDFDRLLAEICPDEESFPEVEVMDEDFALQVLPAHALEQRFKVCDVPYCLLLSAYKSPLLERLVEVDVGRREFVRFLLPS